MRTVVIVLLALVAIVVPVGAQSIHDRIFQPPIAPLSTAALPPGAQLITVKTRDGLTLAGAAIAARSDRPVLLVFHGNSSSADGTLAWFEPLIARGYGIVAAEYRGYSGNPGRPDEAGLAADADAFYAEAQKLAGGRPVIVVGHSLGGGVAFGLAARQKLDMLVTIGTFSRLRAMAPKIVRAFIKDRYDNLATVPSLDEPYILIHGEADDVVSPSEAGLLYEAAHRAHRAGRWFVVKGAGHRPDGGLIAQIVDAAAANIFHPEKPQPALPTTIKTGAFL